MKKLLFASVAVLSITPAFADGVQLVAPSSYAQGVMSGSQSSSYTHAPTLVQQLQTKLAYQLGEIAEGNIKYYGPASKNTAANLAKALAAEAAGAPLPPIMKEGGTTPVPLSQYSHTSYTDSYTPPVTAPAPVATETVGEIVQTAPTAEATPEAPAEAVAAPDTETPSETPDTETPSETPDTESPSEAPDTNEAPSTGGESETPAQ